MSTLLLFAETPSSSSLVMVLTFRSCRSYRIAAAGVRTNEPATITVRNGSPNSKKGLLAIIERYLAPNEFDSVEDRNFLD